MANKWVFINQTTQATRSGAKLTDDNLKVIAEVVAVQLNSDYATECGVQDATIRVSDGSDLAADEKPYYFVDVLPDAPGASAYHVPGAAYCAVTTCEDIFGPGGVSVDASHECLEDAGNPGCNMAVDDGKGQEHERERCDAVEVQTYPINHPSGQAVHVSNFLLDSWQVPGSRGPFSYMSKHGIAGYVEPPGPFQTAAGNGGNYQLVFPSGTSSMQGVFGKLKAGGKVQPYSSLMGAMKGVPRKRNGTLHWTSRASRILANKNDVIQKAGLALAEYQSQRKS